MSLSFLSVSFSPATSILKDNGILIALIKPQFEAGRREVKRGLIKDKKMHERVLEEILTQAQKRDFLFRFNFFPLRGKGKHRIFRILEKGGQI